MREKGVDLIEVHVSGVCFLGDSVLVAKRASNRKIYPNLWECGGGQVRRGESFEEAVLRQLKEELGVKVKILQPFKTYEIPPKDSMGAKIPGIRFICEIEGFFEGNSPKISKEHTEGKIMPIKQLGELNLIPGLKEDIYMAHSEFKKSKL